MLEQSHDDGDAAHGFTPNTELALARALAALWLQGCAAQAEGRAHDATAFEQLSAEAPFALFELDEQGWCVRANRATSVVLGRAIAPGTRLEPLIESDAFQPFRAALADAWLRGESQRALAIAGRARCILVTRAMQARRALVAITSEPARARAGEACSPRTLRAILGAARDGVALFSGSELVYANQAWQRLTASLPSGTNLLDEVVEERSLALRLAELAAREDSQTLDVRLGEGTAQEVLAELAAVALEYDGRPCMLVSARDLTARRKLEAQVARSERLASLGMLVAGVAHEINNPLTYTLANLESLSTRLYAESQPLSRSEAEEALHDATDGCQRIATIIRELRSFYRVDDHEVTALDPNQVVRDAVRIVGPKCASLARLLTELGEVPCVRGNQTSLVQVLINLIVNAIDAMPERDPEHNQVRISTGRRGGDVRFEVTDNGRGIAPADISRIFEPFFSRGKSSGSGLGLTISRNLIEQMNGWIDVESRVGVGTRFSVHLEAVEYAMPRPGAEAPAPPTTLLAAPRVLVVDDEPLVARSVGRLLASAAEVICVHSVASALDVLAMRGDIDVVIADWVMPDGGARALRRSFLEHGLSAPPLIVMTGLGQLGERDSIDGPCVRKPVSREALLRAIASTLVESQAPRELLRADPRESAEFLALKLEEEPNAARRR